MSGVFDMQKSVQRKFGEYVTAGLVFLSRLKFFPANFSALGSFGFFSQNIWLYMATIILFDWLVGGFYIGFLYTYAGFLGYFILGKLAHKNRQRQMMLLPMASLLFFLISNFGVWLSWYPPTLEGFVKCYVNALPFYRNTLLGDIFFGYGYLLIQHFLHKKSIEENKVFNVQ